MANLPYLTTPGNLAKAFTAMRSAATPDRVSQDFVKTILGIPGGSGDNMTTFLKRSGFAEADGKPSKIYSEFRNTKTSKAAVAEAMRIAYAEIFRRNQFAYNLTDDEIKGHVIEITGNAEDARNVALTVSTFANMNTFADFDSGVSDGENQSEPPVPKNTATESSNPSSNNGSVQQLGLNLGYTINLNLPATNDPTVFNAIFKSLKENLLESDD